MTLINNLLRFRYLGDKFWQTMKSLYSSWVKGFPENGRSLQDYERESLIVILTKFSTFCDSLTMREQFKRSYKIKLDITNAWLTLWHTCFGTFLHKTLFNLKLKYKLLFSIVQIDC